MLNIGSRPTVNHNADHRSIEVNLFDFDSDIYGEHLELIFFRKLREEQKFDSLDALKEQLSKDKVETISFFQTINQ
jgi:riboflavin kinase / FMN adenylyltransferase